MLPNRLAEAATAACGGIFYICGGDGERQDIPKDGDGDEQEDNRQQPPDSDSDDSQDNGQTDGQDNRDTGDESGDGDSEDELDRLKRASIALKAENTRLKNAQAKAKGDRDAAAERDDLRAENEKLKSVVNSKFLEWSIQTNDKYNWIDVEDVVKAIDREAINIDVDSGDIDGLDLELKRISKKKPHWLKRDEEQEQQQSPPRSGAHPFGGSVKQDEAERQRLGNKFKIPGFGSQAQKFM